MLGYLNYTNKKNSSWLWYFWMQFSDDDENYIRSDSLLIVLSNISYFLFHIKIHKSSLLLKTIFFIISVLSTMSSLFQDIIKFSTYNSWNWIFIIDQNLCQGKIPYVFSVLLARVGRFSKNVSTKHIFDKMIDIRLNSICRDWTKVFVTLYFQ